MGLTSALNTALNGLSLNETLIDVLGNNISNAGTNGFKASNVLFTTQLARTLSVGSRPTATNGGTNPQQIGLGATTAAINADFGQGSITNSTSPSDLAIQGEGFFVVDGADGNVYSRNGNFSLNSASLLTNAAGLKVQGYGVDADFGIITTQLTDISIPLGDLNVAQQTQNVSINGALLPTGALSTQGTISTSAVLTDTATTNPALAGALLVNLQVGGNNLFTNGETLSFTAQKGGRTLDPQTLAVTGTTTYAELATLLDGTIGIHSGGTIPNDPNSGGQPGVSIVGGALQVVGNSGTVNGIVLAVGDITSNGITVPLSFTASQAAVGESAITDFVVFDSLGQPVTVKLTSVLQARDTNSTTFRYFIESADDSDADVSVSTGTIQFDSTGQVIAGGTATFSVDRNNSAAVSPMQLNIDFSAISGISSDTAGSTLSLNNQDGSDPGTLTSFVIDETGVINGVFDNGIVRTLGQITLARFSNPQGLVQDGSGTFLEGVSSGPPFVSTPGNFGAGSLRSGAIELSNTDVGRNLVDLIVASTNYRGNARVISSVQQLVDELLVLGR
ncbi:MAG: flagellar hook-basal body complex protein [Planctomycetaceae bacterium]|jgi:flagellar hook protein FlgE|nr:flagellar hook-basal body complex protein [Planctomycetaceae bacterium]MBT6483449.1 flagellar hook-basal body complex protein [Planctomycetaceae bacterium]MBT6493899.1 flagellar hook-basal body complex protein [Planctomycetaceae bacterium]